MIKNVMRAYFVTKAEIENKLMKNIQISKLDVIDTSGGCGASFSVKIKSPDFNGMNIISMHRKVNEILKDELKDIHALQLKTEGDSNIQQ
jgi:stress-induced morphogen